MKSLRSVVASMEGEFLCSVDIRDAYLHVPICVRHQRFLRFTIQGHHYQFTALPFGLASAPRVFTKLMAILRSKGILVIPYLDDLLIKGPSRRDCSQSLQLTLDTLLRVCWIINYQKSSLIPTQRLEFLGMEFDTSQAQYLDDIKHKTTLLELQKMFTYLMESECKAYNPRPFCKTYTMDKQPLNTGEQKDMTEFFTDLITKIEEMSPELKNTVKSLFGGVITNNVVSLDCEHVSQTAEEFYTVRCQVADMKNIYESLDEVTIKDTLEGDNMYTCSHCGKKVRAEKRACFKKLPRILSFNTMRYTFNMVTMMKEKVNTHFSFPLRLDMTPYTEDFLMGKNDRIEGAPPTGSNTFAYYEGPCASDVANKYSSPHLMKEPAPSSLSPCKVV
ncbi:unnamed protein product [Ranitomeya imitator]|uniref:ribonuclease H n=1 Tax=Ranitomeya imitator TaxID=111125 RepID=A0ABN9L569_9NEOB|nr:unnamed protein product [Ranitomeya imitator]